MGLIGKKKGKEQKPEEIGGLLADTVLADKAKLEASSPLVTPVIPPRPSEPAPDPEKGKKIDSLSSLEIFASETSEEESEGRKLSEQLPDVDVHELLAECKGVVARLKGEVA